MSLIKITEQDFTEASVKDNAPDTPQGTAEENKYIFDRLACEKIIPRFNALIDALEKLTGSNNAGDVSGADNIGCQAITGIRNGQAGTVREFIIALKAQIDDVVKEGVAENSVSAEKLTANAVMQSLLTDYAILSSDASFSRALAATDKVVEALGKLERAITDLKDGTAAAHNAEFYKASTEDGSIANALSQKQATLTFDSIPTENSENPVTSDGIFTTFAGKADKTDVVGSVQATEQESAVIHVENGQEGFIDAAQIYGNTTGGGGTPDSPIAVKSVPSNFTIRSVKDNLFEQTEFERGTIDSISGINNSSTTRLRTKSTLTIAVTPSTVYNCQYQSILVGARKYIPFFYTSDNTYIRSPLSIDWADINVSFTTPDNCVKLRIAVQVDSQPINVNDISNQILYNDNNRNDVALCVKDKDGNLYSLCANHSTIYDEITARRSDGKRYIVKKCRQVTLNGTETWYRNGTNLYTFNCRVPNNEIAANGRHKINNLTSSIDHRDFDVIDCLYASYSSLFIVSVPSLGYTEIVDFKTWLTTHNIVVEYSVVPNRYLEYEMDETEAAKLDQIKQYAGVTNVFTIVDNATEENPTFDIREQVISNNPDYVALSDSNGKTLLPYNKMDNVYDDDNTTAKDFKDKVNNGENVTPITTEATLPNAIAATDKTKKRWGIVNKLITLFKGLGSLASKNSVDTADFALTAVSPNAEKVKSTDFTNAEWVSVANGASSANVETGLYQIKIKGQGGGQTGFILLSDENSGSVTQCINTKLSVISGTGIVTCIYVKASSYNLSVETKQISMSGALAEGTLPFAYRKIR